MKSYKSKYLEINVKKKQHLAFKFFPYGFGYDYPLFVLKLFIISFYLKLPFKIKEKNNDISYGYSFNDYDQPHWLPDYLHLSFGIHTKSYDMPWHLRLFETKYDAKVLKGDIHIKDINKNQRIFKYNTKIKTKNENIINASYYKETRVLKYKIFGRFINYGKKEIYVLNIDYDKPNTDLNERGIVSDMMFLNPEETVIEGFYRYCATYKLNILSKQK